jgi:SprT protein
MARIEPPRKSRWTQWFRRVRQTTQCAATARATHPRPRAVDDELTAWCSDTAARFGLAELSRSVLVSWNPRMQTTAGRAGWPHRTIELNPKLRDCGQEEVWRTLKHELAHLMAYERNPRRRIAPHGPEWRSACAALGIPDERPCHTLPFPRRSPKRTHAYTCPHCAATMLRVRPIRRAVACYACCQQYNHGHYDSRFQLVKQTADDSRA